MCFIWPRVPYAIFGVFALVLLPGLFVYVINNVDFVPFRIIAYFAVAITAFLSNTIFNFGRKKASVAHTAMVTRGIVYGNLPDDVKREGYKVARHHYTYLAAGEIAKRGIGLFYKDVMHKNTDWKYARKTDSSFLSELGSFLALFIASFIPYLGTCTVAWEFAYPGNTLEESICDSLEVFFRNWKRMLVTIIVCVLYIAFIVAVACAIGTIVFGLLFILVPNSTLVLESIVNIESINDFSGYGVLFGWVIFFDILLASAVIPFANARTKINIIKQYFIGADRVPPKGIVYAKYAKKITEIKQHVEEHVEKHVEKKNNKED